jgi:hypothetical protein
MTGIQALERAAPDMPMNSGRVLRREYEYIRHGTQCLIAAFDIATGSVKGTVGERRTEEDLTAFLKNPDRQPATTNKVGNRCRQPQYPFIRRHGPTGRKAL